ncbi:MAG: hypothetical protein ACQKBY_08740 [Verrucomicrobiales bacterium]
MNNEEAHFDPITVRDLIRRASLDGHHPQLIILGRRQAASYRDYVVAEYGEAPKSLRDCYFLGLQLVESDVDDLLTVVGDKLHSAWDQQLRPLWEDDHHPHRPGGQAAA